MMEGLIHMEFAKFSLNFLQIFAFISVLLLISSSLFKNKKALFTVITNFILLVFINCFAILQLDFILENFPNYIYGLFILLIIMYYVFIRDLISYIKSMKSERDQIK